VKVQTLPSRTILERDGAPVTPEIAPTVPAQPRRWSRRHAYQCFQQGTAHVTDGRHAAMSSSIPIDVSSRSEPLTRRTELRPGRRWVKPNRYRIVIYDLHAGRLTDLDFEDPGSRRAPRWPRRHTLAPCSTDVSPTPPPPIALRHVGDAGTAHKDEQHHPPRETDWECCLIPHVGDSCSLTESI
jgi:hypothetical protein